MNINVYNKTQASDITGMSKKAFDIRDHTLGRRYLNFLTTTIGRSENTKISYMTHVYDYFAHYFIESFEAPLYYAPIILFITDKFYANDSKKLEIADIVRIEYQKYKQDNQITNGFEQEKAIVLYHGPKFFNVVKKGDVICVNLNKHGVFEHRKKKYIEIRKLYKNIVNDVLFEFDHIIQKPFLDIIFSFDKINEIMNHWAYDHGNSTRTLCSKIWALRNFLGFLEDSNLLSTHVDKLLGKIPKYKKTHKPFLDFVLFNGLLNIVNTKNSIYEIRDEAIMRLVSVAPLRVSEMDILLQHIDHRTNEIYVPRIKGDRDRTIWLSDKAMNYLNKYLEVRPRFNPKPGHEQFLFINYRGKRLNQKSYNRLYQELQEKAGYNTRHSFHTIRKTLSTELAVKGASNIYVTLFLGHKLSEDIRDYVDISAIPHKLIVESYLSEL